MRMLTNAGVLILAYLIGSIPFGLLIVKLGTGKDVRAVASGRTGGTNAMRAGGMWAGLGTAIMDFLKGACTVWLAEVIVPGSVWLKVFAPLMSILGHNYSIFLTERDERGRLRLRGGAGGAPCVGGSFGFWAPSFFIIVPIGALIWYFVGYASITTLSAALISTTIFVIRAWILRTPWQYAVFGIIAEFLLAWSLRPNIKRLIQGNERLVGWRARRQKVKTQPSSKESKSDKAYSSSSSL